MLVYNVKASRCKSILKCKHDEKKQRFLQVINILKKQKLRTEMREASLTAAIIRK